MRTSTRPSLRLLAAWLLAVCLALPAVAPAEETSGFHWKVDEQGGTADLLRGDQPVLRYMYAYDTSSPERTEETFKVYHHVFAPDSQTIITKGPGGLYTHHRGLYVGWNKTEFDGKSLDFWHGRQGVHQRHERFIEKEGDDESGRMTSEIHWNDAEGEAVIVERRTLVVTQEPKTEGWQIDWSSTIESRRGEIKLDGDRQHAGFQYRAAQDVAEAQGARFLRPADFSQDTKAIEVGDQGDPPAHINLGWFAMTYELDGQRYTVEYFDNPELPKPSLFSERPYGRFGTFFKTTLSEGEPLEMKYRVVVSSGEAPSVEAIQQRYEEFVASLKD